MSKDIEKVMLTINSPEFERKQKLKGLMAALEHAGLNPFTLLENRLFITMVQQWEAGERTSEQLLADCHKIAVLNPAYIRAEGPKPYHA